MKNPKPENQGPKCSAVRVPVFRHWCFITVLLALSGGLALADPLGTAFTYQGRLASGGNAANGIYDFRFAIYDSTNSPGTLIAGPITNSAAGVSNGLFCVTLDFGSGVFDGNARWLDIAVRTNGSAGDYHILTPRQPLTPAPYALYAPNAGFATTANNVGSNAVTASSIAGGQVVKSLNGLQDAITLAAGANVTLATNGNTLQISAGTNGSGGTALAGYRENGPFAAAPLATGNNAIAQGEGAQALGKNSVVGGGLNNLAIEWYSAIAGGSGNQASGSFGFVGGGDHNAADGLYAFVGGGNGNVANNQAATVGGGHLNAATSFCSVVGGGNQNNAFGEASTVAGGNVNGAYGDFGAVGGGQQNSVAGTAATVPGGYNNRAIGNYSLAAGQSALALHQGSMVFADSQPDVFASQMGDEFSVRALNGLHLETGVGVHLNAANRPLIVRDWDPFADGVANGKAGIGRWGLFMEPYALVIGIPNTDVGPRSMEVARYNPDGTRQTILKVGNDSTLTMVGNVTITSPTNGATLVQLGEGLDYAEGFDVAARAKPAPGTVLVIDAESPGKLAVSRKAYDRAVAGIVAGARGLGSAVRVAAGQFDCDVALAGRVYCNVEAASGAIAPGDLLTTSSRPGHAMRVDDPAKAHGAILGKAMQGLAKGETGQILVLVTLQ